MESTTPVAPEPSPEPAPARAAASSRVAGPALVVVCLLEVALAFWALQVADGGRGCPDLGPSLGCAAVFRPRLSRLIGPITVTQVAFVGAMASLGLAFMVNARQPTPRPLLQAGLVGLGAGAGLAVGLQPLPWTATGAACALCVGLCACALATLSLALPLAARAGVSWRLGLLPFALALVAVAPFAARHGARVAEDDAVRIERARAARGDSGPRLLLVTQERCPYCHGLLTDVLGDEQVVRVLQRTRGLTEVTLAEARARGFEVEGAPTLIVVDLDGRERGRMPEGYASDPAAYATRLLTLVETSVVRQR